MERSLKCLGSGLRAEFVLEFHNAPQGDQDGKARNYFDIVRDWADETEKTDRRNYDPDIDSFFHNISGFQ